MKQSRWTVYCHIHRESGRRYVGVTKKTWRQRWNQHVYTSTRLAKKGWSHFANAIRKYRPEAFDHEVLEVCSSLEEANAAEQRWIDLYDTRNPVRGFNIKKGGDHRPHPVRNPWDRPEFRAANAGRNTKHLLTPEARAKQQASMRSPESKAKRSALAKASLSSPETVAKRQAMRTDAWRERISASLKASLSSDTVRARMSEAARSSATPEVRERLSKALKQAMSREETRQRLSDASRRNWQKPEVRERILSRTVSDETRRKLSAAATGRRHTPESRALQAELARLRWADPAVRAAHAEGMRRARSA